MQDSGVGHENECCYTLAVILVNKSYKTVRTQDA